MNAAPSISPDDLQPVGSLLIKPVSALCNLACSYCFYLDRETDPYAGRPQRRMTDEVLERVVAEFEGYRFPVVTFAWQGGEPTLAGLDFFRRAVDLQQEHGRPGQVVSNSLQTNGMVIDADWASFLAEYRFLVGVSLDGPREIHDRHRRNRAGAGSWERVMRSLEILRDAGVEVNILCCVHRGNFDRAAELHAFFRELGIDYVQYIPIAEYDAEGRPRPETVSAAQYGRFLVELFDAWWPDRERLSVRFFDNVLERLLGRQPGSCTMHERCESYLVVEYNGDVYPCDFFVEEPWKIGNIAQAGIRELARSPLRARFAARKLLPRTECEECGYEFLCRRGCPKLRHARRGAFEDLDVFCESYRTFYEHALERLRERAAEIQKIAATRPATGRIAPTGRNDPCPCGSGRKYKNCCGR